MSVSRRSFLLGTGAATVSVWGGPLVGHAAAVESHWQTLRSQLSGDLVLPGDSGYTTAKRGFNALYDGRKPAAIARARSVKDVQSCIRHAREHDVPIAARSGGHSYTGYSTVHKGLIVDLSGISGVRTQSNGRAVIGAGARLGQVYNELAAAGRALPGGTCPTVGIGGLTLGGGIGVLTRKYGLTCDKLVAATIVTADGKAQTVSAESRPKLFWALRGGGGGNFGIVTSFTFASVAAPRLTVFALRFPAGTAAGVLDAWQDWIASAPDSLWSNVQLTSGSQPGCRVGGCYVGSAANLEKRLAPFEKAVGVKPTSRFVQAKSYLDAMRYFAGSTQRQTFTASSRMLGKRVDGAKIVDAVSGHSGLAVLIDSLGGAVAAKAPSDTAFVHRKALASVQIYGACTPATRSKVARSIGAVRDELGKLGGASGYVNYIDASMPSWANAYYGSNVDGLRTVARAYDPDGVFAFAQGIGKA